MKQGVGSRLMDRERSLCRPHALVATDSRLKTTSGWSLLDTERSNATGGVRRAKASTSGRLLKESLSHKTARVAEKQKVLGAHFHRKEFATT